MGDGDETLTVACRFTSLDQWLTTHVGSSWKVKHVKVWLLAKCLGIPLASSLLDDSTRTSGLGSKKRSASPITFAPDPRRRPASPILFAKGNKKQRGRSGHSENGGNIDATSGLDDNLDDYFLGDDVGGFDDDDEDFPSDPEQDDHATPPETGPIPSFISDTEPAPGPQVEVNLTAHPTWMKYNSDSKSYTLIRFSTGQILEDEYSLSWYELSPFELLEMHAHQPIQALPPSFTKTPGSNSHHTSHSSTSSSHQKHRRAASLYSLAGSDSHNSQLTGSVLTLHKSRFMAPLNRQTVTDYVQPYWEGYVRALRVVWKEDAESMANFQNGYGLGYVGAPFPKGGAATAKDPSVDFMGRKRVLEWSLKWVVIKDGMLSLCRSPEDTSPTHVLPLSSLTALRNNEQLFNHPYFTDQKDAAKPPFMRSPYPPRATKDKSGRKDKNKTKHKEKPHDILALADPSFTSPKSKRAGRSHISNMSLSMSSTISRDSTASDSDEETAQDYGSDFRGGGKRRGSLLPDLSFGGTGHSTHHSNASGLSQSWSERSGVSGHVRSRSHLVDGEPIDDLKIVCVKYRSSERVRALLGGFSHRDMGADVDGQGPVKEKLGDGDGTKGASLWRSDTDKKDKGKGKAGKLLGLGKDDKGKSRKLKSKNKEKEKDKEKGKDWISALAGGSKGKEREKDDTWQTTTATSTTSTQTITESLHPSHHDRYDSYYPTEEVTSAYPSSIYQGHQPEPSPTSPGGAIRFARMHQSSEHDSSDEEGEMEDEGDDLYDTYPNAPGDAGTTDLHPQDEAVTRPGDPDTSSFSAHVQITSDVNPEADVSQTIHPRNRNSVSSHTHPHEELQELEHDISSDIGSSPKFAHSEDTEDDVSDAPENPYRHGYRYGYQHETYEAVRWGRQPGEPEHEMLHEHEDRMAKEKVNLERRRRKELARKQAEQKEREKQDWIVLDMGTDLAFQSFLRVLHRHLAPPVQSSFVNVPNYATPHHSRSPTPTRTPYPSPTSPRGLLQTQPFQWTENPELDEEFPTETKSSIVQSASITIVSTASTDSLSNRPRSTGSTSSQEDRFQFDASSQHPPALAALSSHPPATAESLGVLPYPEWRIEVTERAQRAGVGEIGRGLKWVLWQDQHQLDLDLHEARRHGGMEEGASAELRRLRRETLSLKNRRRSSASAAPTIIGSKSGKSAKSTIGSESGSSQRKPPSHNLTIYDSDVSEDTGELIDDSDSETSEVEWVGWMADLHRQYQIQEERKKEPRLDVGIHRQPNVLYPPRTIEEDRLSLKTRRQALEPSASVSIAPTVQASSATTPAATLYTASSSESLRRPQNRSMAFSPVEGSASPTQISASHSSQHSHSNSQTTSPLAMPQNLSRRQLAPGAALSHSTSMYGSGLRSTATAAAMHAQRRPSMPSLIDTSAANALSLTSILRSPGASQSTFSSSRVSVPFSPSFSSFHATTESSSSHQRDRDPDKGKGKGRAEAAVGDAPPGGSRTPRAQRPKLSVTTQSAASESRGAAFLRHVKSNSSFVGPPSVAEEPSSSMEQRPVQRKKAKLTERIAKKLDSAIDFVDGGW